MTDVTHVDSYIARRHTLVDAFWILTERSHHDGCWTWLGSVAAHGYGRLRKNGTMHLAHRLSYEIHHGPIPEGWHVDHTCHNSDTDCRGGKNCKHRRCVNPQHLEAVPPVVNILRGKGPAAEAARRTHCPAGHELSGENLSETASGYRVCRACKRERATIWNAEVSRRRAARRALLDMRHEVTEQTRCD